MALDKAVIPVNFGQGVDTKNDPKVIDAGKMTVLQNGVFTVGKRISKRNGYTVFTQSIQGGGSISSGTAVAAYNSELNVLDGTNLYSYSPGVGKHISRGYLPANSVSTTAVCRTSYQQTQPDSSYHSGTGLQIFTYNDTSIGAAGTPGIKYSILDTSTGAMVVNNTTLSTTATKAKVLTLGSKFVIIYYESSGTSLSYRTIDTTTPTTLSGATSINTDISTVTYSFDATVIGTTIYIAYRKGTTQIAFYSLSNSFVLSSQFVVAPGDAVLGIALAGDGSGNVWCGYGANGVPGSVKLLIVNGALNATVLAAVTVESSITTSNITLVVNGSTATVFYDSTTGSTGNYIKSNTVTLLGVVGTAQVLIRLMGLASKVFTVNSVNYMLAVYDGIYVATSITTSAATSEESTYFLINASGQIAAKLAQGNGGGYYAQYLLPEVNVISSVANIPFLFKDNLSSLNGNVFYLTGVMNALIGFTATPQKLIAGSNLMVNSGQTYMYDGANAVEYGFNVYPENVTTTLVPYDFSSNQMPIGAVGPGNSPATTNQFQYRACYEWSDNQGQLHRSAPSPAITLTLANGSTPISVGATLTNASANVTLSTTSGLERNMYMVSSSASGGQFFNAKITNIINSTQITVDSNFQGSTGAGTCVFYRAPMGVITANTVAGSKTLTSVFVMNQNCSIFGSGAITQGTTSLLQVGQAIYDSGTATSTILSAGAEIASIDSTTQITLTEPAAGTVNGFILLLLDCSKVTVQVPALTATAKSNVVVSLYRTTNNGTVFYRVSSLTSPNYSTPSTQDYVTITDTSPDGAIIGNEQLYTNGGEVDNIAPPPFLSICGYKTRAVGISAEQPYSFWYSKDIIPGSPVQWSDLFVENVDASGGPLTACAQLDDKLILFKRNKIFFTAGDGPAPSGVNNDFINPQIISSETGCNNPVSVVLTPVGLMYQSPKGIYLLDRSLQNKYIGAEVESFNSYTITSSVLIENVNQIRFTLSNGTALVYDYFYNQWSTFTNHQAVDATIYNHNYTFLTSAGVANTEAPSTFTDNGSFIQLSMTTGWMSLASIQALQRVWHAEILGDYKSAHTLQINIAYDYASSFSQNVSIPVLSAPTTPYQFRVHISQQKCQAMQIQIQDSQSSNFGEGMSLTAMSFDAGLKKGLEKLPAAQSFG